MKLCMIGARGHSYYVLNDLPQIEAPFLKGGLRGIFTLV